MIDLDTYLHRWRFDTEGHCVYDLYRIFSIQPSRKHVRDTDGNRYEDDWENRRIGYSPVLDPKRRYYMTESNLDCGLANPGGAVKIAVTTSPDEELARSILAKDLEQSRDRYLAMADSMDRQIEKARGST